MKRRASSAEVNPAAGVSTPFGLERTTEKVPGSGPESPRGSSSSPTVIYVDSPGASLVGACSLLAVRRYVAERLPFRGF